MCDFFGMKCTLVGKLHWTRELNLVIDFIKLDVSAKGGRDAVANRCVDTS